MICRWIFGFFLLLLVGCSTQKEKDFGTWNKGFSVELSDTESIQSSPGRERITIKELAKWDDIAKKLNEKHPLKENYTRFYAYLYQAQKAFADASYARTGAYSGSLDPISMHVVSLFFSRPPKIEPSTDPFSKDLAALVAKQVDARFKTEQAGIHVVQTNPYKGSWHGKHPFGLTIPTMIPWVLTKPDEFRPEKPPYPDDEFWQKQLSEMKESMAHATEEQKKQILFWAGMLIPDLSDWKTIGEEYMDAHNVPLPVRLEARAKLSIAIMDAMIAAYDTKYAYLVPRPFMLDPELKTVIPTPNFPSYPSAHSTVSPAAAAVLSFYFPENEEEWKRLAEEAGLSRIWAGIHYPFDHQMGKEMGSKVGEAVLNQ